MAHNLTRCGVHRRRQDLRLLARGLAAALLAALMTLAGAQPSMAGVYSCSSGTPATSRPTLRTGDSGSCVVTLQKALIAKGYSVGSAGADGVPPAVAADRIAEQRMAAAGGDRGIWLP